MSQIKIIEFMVKNPGWHYGLDLVRQRLAMRCFIYAELADLEDAGLVERRYPPRHAHPGLPRPQFRSLLVLRPR